MPFGLSIAPCIQKMFLISVLRFIKNYTKNTYGHLDDLIVAHPSKLMIETLLDVLRAKLKQAGWELNIKKSTLNPVRKLS